MGYVYEVGKHYVFSEEGQRDFLKIRDNVKSLLQSAGAFSITRASAGMTVDTWEAMACVDRLVELGEIKELTDNSVRGQDRVFTKGKGK